MNSILFFDAVDAAFHMYNDTYAPSFHLQYASKYTEALCWLAPNKMYSLYITHPDVSYRDLSLFTDLQAAWYKHFLNVYLFTCIHSR